MSEMADLPESLKERVYYAARDGMAITLFALLSEQLEENAERLLAQVFNNSVI
jgi:molybdopterin-guanine dinucleotide biosynthesis protein A